MTAICTFLWSLQISILRQGRNFTEIIYPYSDERGVFIRRAQWGTEHICYSFEEEKFDNWAGILLATSCPVLKRNECINLPAFLCLWVVMWIDFSSCPSSSLEGSSLILWIMLDCHHFHLFQASVEEDEGRHYLSIWMHPGLLRKEIRTLPVSTK